MFAVAASVVSEKFGAIRLSQAARADVAAARCSAVNVVKLAFSGDEDGSQLAFVGNA